MSALVCPNVQIPESGATEAEKASESESVSGSKQTTVRVFEFEEAEDQNDDDDDDDDGGGDGDGTHGLDAVARGSTVGMTTGHALLAWSTV